ncbi:hypothetical protein EX895_002095 [Sporisorium graminicola]|uniref:Uncharacterized protein n=1 Tax=Sporisorium graminicola TaxID=280036 RepID=A0A4U7KVW6_9BASI|nr:hypothetical protein EX895_002095 [Sporisorium graminicola]TKY88854.1 hypothetical protein EX895_002095 [Sporisorium graminicola]
MSHLSILSAPLPDLTRTCKGDTVFASSRASSSKHTLTVPDSFLRPSRSHSSSIYPSSSGASSLPGSPSSLSFPRRPGFRRAATSTAVTSINTAESTRFDGLHYSQTHFSRSTLLVYSDSEAVARAATGGEQAAEEDIRELLLASSDEESSTPPSTPGIDTARIPPRGSSVSLARAKQSMDSDKSVLSLPERITLLAPPATTQEMSQSNTELAFQAAHTSMSSHLDDGGSARSLSTSASFKRRSRILMKIIPFTREDHAPPPADTVQPFGTFPRVRTNAARNEPVETLAARFCELSPSSPSPRNSVSSVHSIFSTGGASPSPEMSPPDLPTGCGSGSYARRCARGGPKRPSSKDSVRSLFSLSSTLQNGPSKSNTTSEATEWEQVLKDAEKRAVWQSSISHRPRQHSSLRSGARTASHHMSWPRSGPRPWASQSRPQDTLLLEHMFVDAGGGGQEYGRESYSGLPVGADGSWSLPVSAAGSRRPSIAAGTMSSQVPIVSSIEDYACQSRFGTLPRVKSKRPSTTAMRGGTTPSQPDTPAGGTVLGTSSLGRATALRRRPVPDAASFWAMGRRRSSGLAPGISTTSTRMMPTIPQGHSRETSLTAADDNGPQTPPWLGMDPYAATGQRCDSFASEAGGGGGGELLPFRFFPRRGSQDDLALLSSRPRTALSGASAGASEGPLFNLHPFAPRRPSIGRSASSYDRHPRRFSRPDVPEAVTGSEESADPFDDGDGWCRRRSTLASLGLPQPQQQ